MFFNISCDCHDTCLQIDQWTEISRENDSKVGWILSITSLPSCWVGRIVVDNKLVYETTVYEGEEESQQSIDHQTLTLLTPPRTPGVIGDVKWM